MSYRIINTSNSPWAPGTWFDCFGSFCQRIEPQTRNGVVVSQEYKGLLIPKKSVIPFSVAVRGRGLEVKGHRRA